MSTGFKPGAVAKFRTRRAARDAMELDTLNRWPYTGNSSQWKPGKDGSVWVIKSPGRWATWGDLPNTHEDLFGAPAETPKGGE